MLHRAMEAVMFKHFFEWLDRLAEISPEVAFQIFRM